MPDWNLANGNSFQNALATGIQLGSMARQRQEQKDQRNALAAFAANPNEKTASEAAQYDPNIAMQFRAQQQQQQALGQQKQRADAPMLLSLLNHATDQNTYQQSLEAAQRYGIDVSGAPPQFDPNWVQSQKAIVEAVQTPQGQQALSTAGKQAADEGLKPGTPEFAARVHDIFAAEHMKTVPYQAGGGVAIIDPSTGQVKPLITPNPGNMPAGAPAGQPVRVQSIQEAQQLPPGTHFIDPNGVMRVVPGGSGSNVGGGF